MLKRELGSYFIAQPDDLHAFPDIGAAGHDGFFLVVDFEPDLAI